jgi:hypothetical protein
MRICPTASVAPGLTISRTSNLECGIAADSMDHLNPADFTVPQPYFDSVRVKRGIREKVLDDAAGLFPGALVLFKDN